MSVIELNLTARGKELFDGKDILVRLHNPLLLDNTAEFFFLGQSKCETPGFFITVFRFIREYSPLKWI